MSLQQEGDSPVCSAQASELRSVKQLLWHTIAERLRASEKDEVRCMSASTSVVSSLGLVLERHAVGCLPTGEAHHWQRQAGGE